MNTRIGPDVSADPEAGAENRPCLLRVDRIAGGGDGVGREESGRVVFVPRTAPGDVVRAEIVDSKPRWGRARTMEFVHLGEGRRDAPCPVYQRCGGCRLQHMRPAEQRRAKRNLVDDALRRIGGLEVPIPELIARGSEFGYRNRVTFSSGSNDGKPVAGFHTIDDVGAIADVRRCLLAEESIVAAWEALRTAWDSGIGELPSGHDRKITIRSSADGKVDVAIRGGQPAPPDVLRQLMDEVPGLIGWHHAEITREPVCVAGEETLPDRWQDIEFGLPAEVFLQVNRQVSAAMDEWLNQRADDLDGRSVLDLYSGVGARAIRWAREGANVTACEVSQRASETCRRAASGVADRLAVVTARVEDAIGDLPTADLVVVNPPRVGLTRRVAEALVSGPALELAYVSCDPATLARDLDRLRSAWQGVDVQPFDAFPQTAHVETAVWLERC